MRRLAILSAALAAILAGPAAAAEWHFVGTRLTKPDRLFYFVDMASVARTDTDVVTFAWSVYGESQPAGMHETYRWSRYSERIDCRANTSQSLSMVRLKPDGAEAPAGPRPTGWDTAHPIAASQPAYLFAELLCRRAQVKTLPIGTYPIPHAVVELVKQLP